jgi:uncharacterized protein YijF (DUF1287 family)
MKRYAFVFILLLSILGSIQAYPQSAFLKQLADSSALLTKDKVRYDPSYFQITYPMGDVPANRGVCTDVVIRAYRKMGVDLQELVHKDMAANFDLYPKNWKLTKPDKNIDHRRVPNLMTFFGRKGKALAISQNAADYKPGHIGCWNLGGGILHIGIVSDKKSSDGKRYLIIHNIGAGQVFEDCLFNFTIIGHYIYDPM